MKKCATHLIRTILCVLMFSTTLLSVAHAGDESAAPKAKTDATRKPTQTQRHQLNPAITLATLLPEAAEIDLGVAIVPDPRVARYQRPYDLGLVAMELGMLKNGYVLDRFYLPWYSDAPADETPEPVNSEKQGPPRYGLMLFRCDAWRSDDTLQQAGTTTPECATPGADGKTSRSRFRALYIVPDVSTTGVDARIFQCVVSRIASQLSPAAGAETQPLRPQCLPWKDLQLAPHAQSLPAVRLLTFPGLCEEEFSSALVVLGPTFSGSVDSLGALSERLDATQTRISRICAISSSTSDSSNFRANSRYQNLQFTSLALENNRKLAHLARLVTALTQWAPAAGRPDPAQQAEHLKNRVVILAEASTFGSGVCLGDLRTQESGDRYRLFAQALCDSAVYLYFPANIADVRYGLLQARADEDANSPLNLKLPTATDHLPLQLGKENGSEYPESRQSGLTSVSAELALERGLDSLKELSPVPEIVIVVATDVRDRLFLFDEVRARLPGALLIDLEADNLLAHPDFLHASRSALSFASAALTAESRVYGCESGPDDKSEHSRWNPIASWSSDVQALYADAVAGLATSDAGRNRKPCLFDRGFQPRNRRATIQVVTLAGFREVSTGYVTTGSAAESTLPVAAVAKINSTRFEIIEASAPLLCLTAAWLWLSPLVLPRRRDAAATPAFVWFADSFCKAMCILCAAFLVTGGYYVHQFDPDNALPFWLVVAMLGGFVGLHFWIKALRRVRRAALRFNSRSALAPASLALSAAILACAPLLWLGSTNATYKDVVDIAQLIELAVDPHSGMAFFLVIGLATIALLHASIILTTGAGIVNRNSNVLRGAEELVRPANKEASGGRRHRRGMPALNPYGLLGLSAIVIALVVLRALVYGEVRLTLFGKFASHAALFAIVATSFSAALLACSAMGSARRVRSVSRFFAIARAPNTPTATLWPPGLQTPRIFATTPVVALAATGGEHARKLIESDQCDAWTRELKEWLYDSQDDSTHRIAAFTLLAVEISQYRWSVLGGVSCALASVATIWLFPIEADLLVILNLGLLVALGVSSGLVATSLERDEVLSSLLCNRKARRRFSTPLFMFIALPFLAFSLALAIANVPGVVDWGGGLLQLITALGLHP